MARLSNSQQSPPPSKKRKSTDGENAEQTSRGSKKRKYAYLKPTTRHISQDLIRNEWKSLPKPAQLAVRDIFLAAKRTTLTQILDGPRRREAEFVVNDVLRRLEKQMPRMPFPPGTKAENLGLDGILENVRMLEAEKGPLTDSVKLLEEEIEREEQRVEAKRKELSSLEKESKVAAKQRKTRATRTHGLLESVTTISPRFDDADNIGLVASKSPPIVFDEDDADLAPILSQLQSHFDSIKANTEQLPEIEAEMLRTRMSLRNAAT